MNQIIPSKIRLTLFSLLAMWYMAGCSKTPIEESTEQQKLVFIDPRTSQLYTSTTPMTSPVAHPKTGRKTLVTAMYCTECEKWYPVPPIEIRERNPEARNCPKEGKLLVPQGEIPDSAIPLAQP